MNPYPPRNQEDARVMVEACGRLIGHGFGMAGFTNAEDGQEFKTRRAVYYILDGKVWQIFGHDPDFPHVEIVGDYFEFCQLIRAGCFESFLPLGGFHLTGDTGDDH